MTSDVDALPSRRVWNARLSSLRRGIAAVLGAVGVLGLIAGGWSFVQLNQASAAGVEGDAVTQLASPQERSHRLILASLGTVVGLAGLGLGGWVFGRTPATTPQADDGNRRTIGVATGALGSLLVVMGLCLTFVWASGFVDWIAGRNVREAWKGVTALGLIVFGCAGLFATAALLRVDERTHQHYRRWAYGLNTALTLFLLLLAGFMLNVLVSVKVPLRIDTTAAGLNTLNPDTKVLIASLPNEVTVYSTVVREASQPELNTLGLEVQRLLVQCRDANPDKFKYEDINPQSQEREYNKLRSEHPEFIRNDLGLLVVVKGKLGKFLSMNELVQQSSSTGKRLFVGEQKLVGVLLGEFDTQDSAVYFLQGHGELSITEQVEANASRTAMAVRSFLAQMGHAVKPLALDPVAPKVPDDCAVLVIADPTVALPTEQVNAIGLYLRAPRANKKLGKLVVLAGPKPTADGAGTQDIGLNALLQSYGVTLANRFLYFRPAPTGRAPAELTQVVVARTSREQALTPIASQMELLQMVFRDCQPVVPSRDAPAGLTITPLLVSLPGRENWLEPAMIVDAAEAYAKFNDPEATKRSEVRTAKNLSTDARLLAAAVAKDGVTQIVVIGSGNSFADVSGAAVQFFASNRLLLATCVNTLKDRPDTAHILGQDRSTFTVSPVLNFGNVVAVPTVVICAVILALGLGVWFARRM